jgi:hypothetical protein
MALGVHSSAFNKNEYQEYFLGGKGGRCVGLTLPPPCADCLEIWGPQPPGTLTTCPGLYRDCFTFLSSSCLSVRIYQGYSRQDDFLNFKFPILTNIRRHNPDFDYNRTTMTGILHNDTFTFYYFSPRLVSISTEADETVSIHCDRLCFL